MKLLRSRYSIIQTRGTRSWERKSSFLIRHTALNTDTSIPHYARWLINHADHIARFNMNNCINTIFYSICSAIILWIGWRIPQRHSVLIIALPCLWWHWKYGTPGVEEYENKRDIKSGDRKERKSGIPPLTLREKITQALSVFSIYL